MSTIQFNGKVYCKLSHISVVHVLIHSSILSRYTISMICIVLAHHKGLNDKNLNYDRITACARGARAMRDRQTVLVPHILICDGPQMQPTYVDYTAV